MAMSGKVRQRGAIQLSSMLLLVVFAAALYVGIQVVPIEFHNYELQNRLAQEARIASFYNSDNAQIRSRVLEYARHCQLPLDSHEIVIERSGGAVTIQVQMRIPVQIPFYHWQMNFIDNSASAL